MHFKMHLAIWCQKTLPAITIQFEILDRFVISRNKSSSSDTTDGGSDDLPSEDANTPSMNSEKRKREKTRKYSENYLKFAFTYKEPDGELAVCVVCSFWLSNETMKPSKLQRHSKSTHAHLKEKKHFIFSRLKSFEGQQTMMRQSAKVFELALRASYQVALRVAQTKQPYIIAESLILPAASDMCKTMFGKDEYVKKLK